MVPFQAVLPLPGDGEKELWSDSDYKGKFKEHLLNKRQRVVNQTFARTDTIRGDARSHDGTKMFGTTANRAFPERKPGRREKVPDRVKVSRDLYVTFSYHLHQDRKLNFNFFYFCNRCKHIGGCSKYYENVPGFDGIISHK